MTPVIHVSSLVESVSPSKQIVMQLHSQEQTQIWSFVGRRVTWRLTGVSMCVFSSLSQRADSSSSRVETHSCLLQKKKGTEKCWGRISSCLLNSSLRECVCLSETSRQKAVLTAPLANHDFVMSEEAWKKIIIEKKEQKEGRRWGAGNRGEEGSDGKGREGVRGQEKRWGLEICVAEASATISVLYVPTSSLSVKGD